MNLDQIREILELVREHGLAEFEIEHDGMRLRVRKDAAAAVMGAPAAAPAGGTLAAPAVAGAAPAAVAAAVAGAASPAADAAMEMAIVKSPIVGTFYRAPEPNAAAFVEIGTVVKKGQVLCIIEAMKLMNEIDSEYDGEIVNVYVENGQPVQYGERLFAIRTM